MDATNEVIDLSIERDAAIAARDEALNVLADICGTTLDSTSPERQRIYHIKEASNRALEKAARLGYGPWAKDSAGKAE